MKINVEISFRALVLMSCLTLISCSASEEARKEPSYSFPDGYLLQETEVPPFWINTPASIASFLDENVSKGQVKVIGSSAGGRPILAVFYGEKRSGGGTTTYSGSCGIRNIRPFRGPDNEKTVYLGLAGVHGFELEGITGVINLISVLETGKDINGKAWPEITDIKNRVDRIILIPLLNPDGRDRVPVKMEKHRPDIKDGYLVHEYLNCGGKKDGTLIGWPDVKEYIPMDFSSVGFPGGYPNDAGVNIMHDDFLGKVQPETRALFDLVADEKPDLIINMHTGAPGNNFFMRMHKPMCESSLYKVFDSLYKYVHTGLTLNVLQSTDDPRVEADPSKASAGVYNLDCALNLHCGALSVVIEAPSHGFSGTNRAGEPVRQTPEMILDAELVSHKEAMKFLSLTGGRSKWDKLR